MCGATANIRFPSMLTYPEDCSQEAAVDEAGRGCLAFEVCAAAVVFPDADAVEALSRDDRRMLESIRDSKLLSERKREELAAFIKRFALAWAVAACTPREIDGMNVLNATHVAMHRALDQLHRARKFARIIVDGDKFPHYCPPSGTFEGDQSADGSERSLWIPHRCFPGADGRFVHVAAASILAKTHRDGVVKTFCDADPSLDDKYGFRRNKAYGTAAHLAGLRRHGASSHHRSKFGTVTSVAAATSAEFPHIDASLSQSTSVPVSSALPQSSGTDNAA